MQCFVEVVERTGSTEGYTLLGDAYMAVHMPDKAITTYETALKRNPKDSYVSYFMILYGGIVQCVPLITNQ